VTQRLLSSGALDKFRTSEGVAEQIEHFASLLNFDGARAFSVLDVGGGVGFFCDALRVVYPNVRVTILDLDETSVIEARKHGFEAIHGSIIDPPSEILGRRFDVVSFNLVLHHIISSDEGGTAALQRSALDRARSLLTEIGRIFVHEICYEGRVVPDLTGRLIYGVTSSQVLSGIVSGIARIAPSLRANTAGVGVRFRPAVGWVNLVQSLGFEVIGTREGGPEGHSVARRSLLLIREVRRRSFAISTSKSPCVA
jgi:SAM-dependent methyltransferase